MRDRIVDTWLTHIAGRELGGQAVTAQLVDMAERGLVRIHWIAPQSQECVVTRSGSQDPGVAVTAADRLLLDELFGGKGRVRLRRYSHSRVTTVLWRHARRRTRAAGYWRTTKAPWRPTLQLAGIFLLCSGACVGTPVVIGKPDWITLPLLLAVFVAVMAAPRLPGVLTQPTLTPAGQTAATEVVAYADACRADPRAAVSDRVALGLMDAWPAEEPRPPFWAEGLPWRDPTGPEDVATNRQSMITLFDRVTDAFRHLPRSPEIGGGGA